MRDIWKIDAQSRLVTEKLGRVDIERFQK